MQRWSRGALRDRINRTADGSEDSGAHARWPAGHHGDNGGQRPNSGSNGIRDGRRHRSGNPTGGRTRSGSRGRPGRSRRITQSAETGQGTTDSAGGSGELSRSGGDRRSPGRSGKHGEEGEAEQHSPEAGCDQNGGSNRPISPLAGGTAVGGPASCPYEPHGQCPTRYNRWRTIGSRNALTKNSVDLRSPAWAAPAAEPIQADAREPAAGRWPSGNARTMLSCTKEATRRPSSVKMSALP